MRKRRVAYNEYVDEFGNVRKGYNRTFTNYRENSFTAAFADLSISFLRLLWSIIRVSLSLFGKLLVYGAKNLRREWGKPKPIVRKKKEDYGTL
jgi:hypothetical protein